MNGGTGEQDSGGVDLDGKERVATVECCALYPISLFATVYLLDARLLQVCKAVVLSVFVKI